MLILNEYRVTPEGKFLIIDVLVDASLTGVIIDSVTVTTDGITTSTPINQMLSDALASIPNCTHFRYAIDVDSLGNTEVFFLTVHADSSNATLPSTCRYKNTLTAITFNKYPMYKSLSCLARKFDGCTPNQNFIDFLMRLKAIEAAIAIGDTTAVLKYHKELIKGNTIPYKAVSCGCNS